MENSKKEKTLVLLKPDTVQRALIGEVVSRFERVGLKIVAMKFLLPTKEQAYKHYVKNDAEIEALGNRSIEGKKKSGMEVNDDPKVLGQKIIDRLVAFLSAGPVVALVLEGNRSVAITRKMVGSTEPLQSNMGTIRGDYTVDSYAIADEGDRSVRNLVHASANLEEADYEIKVWFKPEEIIDYKNAFDRILYDVNLDGVLE
ncbi:MAG TPA: nucleoside-diphosphate kinase [Candidatus Paceibacterota bacterium]|jgi:nucleoside-diphosphate kinase|nr:nucleoside-diphosphate kinase [Candidatus Paceibacterota bacterium]HPT40318.1 nucleoside-diphosphate kinase [Candidatus Paceibacterota bacterium]